MTILKINQTAKDGMVIRAKFTKDETQSVKGVVIIVHGFGEHIGGYRELASVLAKVGYANIVFDQRGHGNLRVYGKQEKFQGIIPCYQTLLDDIEIMREEAQRLAPDVPISLYGHSMGGNIILNYLLKYGQSEFSSVILESPWLGLYKELCPVLECVAKVLGAISPKIATYNKLDPEEITGDISKNDEYDKDPFYHNRISMRLFAGVKKGCTHALKNASKITIPIFMASGQHDKIVSNEAIAEYVKNSGGNVTAKEYDAYHAIRKGSTRDEFLNDMINYLDGFTHK